MVAHSKGFHYPAEFPREAFVQAALKQYFTALGFQIEDGGHVDLICRNDKLGQRWIIEAKGETADIGLDFRTGLGQLVQAMNDPSVRYGLAIPDTTKFLVQCGKVSDWVRQAIQLHWLFVRPNGAVKIVNPDDLLTDDGNNV
jgi:hypothetical protein